MAHLKAKKQSLQSAKTKMIIFSKLDKKSSKLPQKEGLTIDEVIKQVINHHIGIMMM